VLENTASCPECCDLPTRRKTTVIIQWFDPRTGEVQSLEKVEGNHRQTFNPPGEPGPKNDWILVLQ
jgi:hypothetical protein